MKISPCKRFAANSVLMLACFTASAQDFTQRGFLETRYTFYPQTAPGDSGRNVGEALLRYEATKRFFKNLRFNGSFDARTDTHRQVEREGFFNYGDRRLQRPAFSVRRASISYNLGKTTLEVGKQFIRWGKADILNPTDRFAPRDFLTVFDNEFLGVTAARLTYDNGRDSLDLVWQPRFTPSRTPLLNQRWAPLPPEVQSLTVRDLGSAIPGGSQLGARYNHIGRGYEASVSIYDGYNHLPLISGQLGEVEAGPPEVAIRRIYPALRFYGADLAIPTGWVTLKGEAGYFRSRDARADDFVLYVVQLERQIGELSLVAGYAGEELLKRRSPFNFAPDRGIARSILGRVAYTIDTNRSLAVETAVRDDGDGIWIRLEYSQAFGQHWRVIMGLTGIQGDRTDFIGQYRRNSNATLVIRYSF